MGVFSSISTPPSRPAPPGLTAWSLSSAEAQHTIASGNPLHGFYRKTNVRPIHGIQIGQQQQRDSQLPGCLIRSEGSVPAERGERAIVCQMNAENVEVKSFFSNYETANATFDLEQIAACYADVFMFGGAKGVPSVKKKKTSKHLRWTRSTRW